MHVLDATLFHVVYDGLPSPWVQAVMLLLSFLGSGWAFVGMMPFLAWRRSRHFTTDLVATLLLTTALVFLAKLAVGRPRPCVALAGVAARCVAPTDFSFPSGHAAGSFAFAAFIATSLLKRGRAERTWAPSLAAGVVLLAIGVSLSRVYLGVHFPSDVLGGAILGSALGVVSALRRARVLDAAKAAATAGEPEHRTTR